MHASFHNTSLSSCFLILVSQGTENLDDSKIDWVSTILKVSYCCTSTQEVLAPFSASSWDRSRSPHAAGGEVEARQADGLQDKEPSGVLILYHHDGVEGVDPADLKEKYPS